VTVIDSYPVISSAAGSPTVSPTSVYEKQTSQPLKYKHYSLSSEISP
jgi:hypothetical protein